MDDTPTYAPIVSNLTSCSEYLSVPAYSAARPAARRAAPAAAADVAVDCNAAAVRARVE